MKKNVRNFAINLSTIDQVSRKQMKNHACGNAIDQVLRRKKLYQPHYCPEKKTIFR